jgi:hypothetical protein
MKPATEIEIAHAEDQTMVSLESLAFPTITASATLPIRIAQTVNAVSHRA